MASKVFIWIFHFYFPCFSVLYIMLIPIFNIYIPQCWYCCCRLKQSHGFVERKNNMIYGWNEDIFILDHTIHKRFLYTHPMLYSYSYCFIDCRSSIFFIYVSFTKTENGKINNLNVFIAWRTHPYSFEVNFFFIHFIFVTALSRKMLKKSRNEE